MNLEFYIISLVLIWVSTEAWIIGRDYKKTDKSEDKNTRFQIVGAIILAIFLVNTLPHHISTTSVFVGGLLMIAGIIVRLRSVLTLGKFFKTTVMVQKDQRVITSGPYTYLRHPSYSGGLLTGIGYSLTLGNPISVLIFGVIAFWAFQKRILTEESLLSQKFGKQYTNYMNHTKRLIPFIYCLLFFAIAVASPDNAHAAQTTNSWWDFQSIDTMKYSRDLARQEAKNPAFDQIIDQQVKNIASAGATHVAIATPYDDEFIPFLTRWVTAARKYNLKVWFRGNWSGWEGWFGYTAIDRQVHIQKTVQFISKHKDLFKDGDIFTSCPECENGGPGDPRVTGDIDGYRQFLISEYNWTKKSFSEIGKKIVSNYYSMNADVADAIMDKDTTAKLDGIVTIDHYVKDPQDLAAKVDDLSSKSGGKIVLGEFGAPIIDINGNMSDSQQADWLDTALKSLATKRDKLVGLNYWVSVGGSTQLWTDAGVALPGAAILKKYYAPESLFNLVIKNDFGKPVANVPVNWLGREYATDAQGQLAIPYVPLSATPGPVIVEGIKAGFSQVAVSPDFSGTPIPVSLTRPNPNLWYRFQSFIFHLFGF